MFMMPLLKELSNCLLMGSQEFLYLESTQGIRLGHGNAFLLKSGRKVVMKRGKRFDLDIVDRSVLEIHIYMEVEYLEISSPTALILLEKSACNPRGLSCALKK